MRKRRDRRTPLTMDEFLRGLFAALAITGRHRVRVGPRVLGEALHWTLKDLAASFERNRIRPAFRVPRRASFRGRGALARTLRTMEDDGLIRLPPPPRGDVEILMVPDEAKDVLRRIDPMIPVSSWAVRCFLRRHATARVRDALAVVAQRTR